MTDLAANKALALRFIDALGRLDTDAFLDCLSDDVMFETPGQHAAAGVKTKSQVALEFPPMKAVLPQGLKFHILTVTAEEHRVHVELVGESKTFEGQDYNNRYHYAFVMRDGKICSFRDYMDSELAIKILIPTFARYGAANLGKISNPAAHAK